MATPHSSQTRSANGVTGLSDADWSHLEQRLADTRDLLNDILVHLRKVLDNLRSTGEHYRSAGRAWRSGAAPGARPASPYARAASPGRPETAGTQQPFSSRTAPSGARRPGQPGQAFTRGTDPGRPSSAAFARDRQSQAFSWSQRDPFQARPFAASKPGAATRTASPGDEARKRQEESQKRQDEFRRRQEEFQKRQQEARRRQEEARRRQEEAKRRQEEFEKRQEEARKRRQESQRQQYARRPVLGSGRMTMIQACALLCVTYPSNPEEIKAAYRQQARRHHPDLGGDEETMKSLNLAYEVALSWSSPARTKAAHWAA